MHTGSAADAVTLRTQRSPAVASIRELIGSGWTKDRIRNQVQADRWQRIGRAVVLHNGAPTPEELRRAALIVLGPRAVLTAFTALEEWGLKGWERDRIHVLVPRGARVARPSALALRVHYTDNWVPGEQHGARLLHRPAPAAVRAAGTFAQSRPACGILAAIVQQRLARPDDLLAAVENAPRTRHRAVLLGAARDIGQGAHALSEIDFARLCRSAHLPEPNRQAVRKDRFERRRYLDVEWASRTDAGSSSRWTVPCTWFRGAGGPTSCGRTSSSCTATSYSGTRAPSFDASPRSWSTNYAAPYAATDLPARGAVGRARRRKIRRGG
jgi:hypothetical protein